MIFVSAMNNISPCLKRNLAPKQLRFSEYIFIRFIFHFIFRSIFSLVSFTVEEIVLCRSQTANTTIDCDYHVHLLLGQKLRTLQRPKSYGKVATT